MSAVRYPITAVISAQRLRAGGETLAEIAEFIGEQYGSQPSIATVRCWCNKRAAERHRARNRKRAAAMRFGATGGRLGQPSHASVFRVGRMAALRDAGLTDSSIAAVMSFDYREHITPMMVASALGADIRQTWRGRARTLLQASPDVSSAEVARRVGVSASSVQKLRKDLGL